MESKQTVFYVAVIVIVTVVAVLIWWSIKKKNDRKSAFSRENRVDTFQLTVERLTDLDRQLMTLINEKTGVNMSVAYISYIGKSPAEVVNNVKNTMQSQYLLSEFTMDGKTMDEPILKMYANNSKLFALLGTVGFLSVIGKMIATTAWTTSSDNPSPESLETFWKCTDNIDWKSHVTWVNLSTTIKKCLPKS